MGKVGLNFSQSEAVYQANRCLYCFDAPCIEGCPARIDIPEFIARVRSRNFLSAAKLIYKENPLGLICGYVCPTENLCEKKCSSSLLNAPIPIGYLQRFVCDYALSKGKIPFEYPKPVNGKVAVIGGGPAGLSCSHFLRQKSHDVVLFEKEEALGGLIRYGIPAYRLPASVVEREIELISRDLHWVKENVSGDKVKQALSTYDAVFLAPGQGEFAKLNIPGEDIPSVFSANQFLKDLAQGKSNDYRFSAREIAVIGAGSTAMDTANSSLSLGAERVTIIYRRTRKEMPASSFEYHAASEKGVQFLWLSNPVSIQKQDSKLLLELEKMRLGEPDPDGRRSPVPTGSLSTLTADFVLTAAATKVDHKILSDWPGLDATPNGQLSAQLLQSTANPKLFLGGDILGGGTVAQAVADGKAAAERIDLWLRAKYNK